MATDKGKNESKEERKKNICFCVYLTIMSVMCCHCFKILRHLQLMVRLTCLGLPE